MPDSHAQEKILSVRLNMAHAPGRMDLLTPGSSMRWGACRFELNPAAATHADFSIVLWNALPEDRFRGARTNTLFMVGEPPGKTYQQKFFEQFGHVVDSHESCSHPGLILDAPGLNWHVGLDMPTNTYRYGYDHLSALERPQKENRIAVVCSNAASTPGHRRRLALLAFLKERLGDRIVHFGRGFEPVDDKMDAILPYRYQLVLENSRHPNYWTEKLADAYLGWAFPVYFGCPNISRFFPETSFRVLDDEDFSAAENTLRSLLDMPEGAAEIAQVAQARERVLNTYNPFAWSARWAEALHRNLPDEDVVIRTHKAYRPFPRGSLYRLRQFMQARKPA